MLVPVVIATPQSYADSFDQMFEKHALVMLLITPETGQIIAANSAASQFYGYSRQTLTQMNIAELNNLPREAVAEERKLANLENRNYFVFRHKLADGSARTVKVSSVPISYRGENHLFSIITDISDFRATQESLWHYQNRLEQMVEQQTKQLDQQKDHQLVITSLIIVFLGVVLTAMWLVLRKKHRTEYELQLERKRLDEIIRGTNVGTWEWHIPSGQVVINDHWAGILGYSKTEVQPVTFETWKQRCHSDDFIRAQHRIQSAFDGKTPDYECEFRMLHKEGFWVWILAKGKVMEWDRENSPVRMVGTHQNINETKRLYLQFEHMAHTDTLTGALNRMAFKQRADAALNHARQHGAHFTLLFIDLDGFKTINDTYGHDAGDSVLIETTKRMSHSIRTSDTLARLGGDEFAVLLEYTSHPDDAGRVAKKIIDSLNAPFTVNDNQQATLSASIGIACYPDHGESVEALLNCSDAAMYYAKKSLKGGTYALCDPTRNTTASNRSTN
ncbi:diguanylate cyclase domain-containing protein [Salinivibrio sp. ES.052]|uniref:diguanylate cyclase domain-containing protein n=1 Tax=Salinivibrio sp. ES.052 TaxID=1882823 RepID=UPI000925F1C0|nr:diguanylate cyclase [Salinivibrio sp. ES.052]SIO31966.1 PAS domain S-box-containing protein/diguanylate cyclase (GGDEF) domain-containing protein [Salinivibrio sp. ES.052]